MRLALKRWIIWPYNSWVKHLFFTLISYDFEISCPSVWSRRSAMSIQFVYSWSTKRKDEKVQKHRLITLHVELMLTVRPIIIFNCKMWPISQKFSLIWSWFSINRTDLTTFTNVYLLCSIHSEEQEHPQFIKMKD